MVFQNGGALYTQGFGTRPENVEIPHLDIRAPASTDVNSYPVGKKWVNTIGNATYTLTSFSSSNGITSATWTAEGGGTTALATLTGDTGTATPVAGNIQIAGGAGVTTSASGAVVTIALAGGSVAMDSFVPDAGTNPVVPTSLGAVTMAGTANQITTTGGTNTLTFSLPASVIAPGSLQTTTSLTAGNAFTVSAGAVTVTTGTSAINISADAAATAINIGTGGAAKTLIMGSSSTTSATTLQAGSGNINLTAINVVQSLGSIGVAVTNQVTNTDNTNPASHAEYQLAVGGGSAGDPYINFLVSGAGVYSMGIDNSATDNFVISANAALGTSNIASWTSAGILTNAQAITATTGNITASNGNLVTVAAASGISLPVTTGTGAASGTVNCNGRAGSVTFTTVSIAGGADLTLTMGNTSITGASTRVLFSMSGATTGAGLSVKSVTPSANQFVWVITNGTALTTTTADITFDFIVLN